MVAEVHLQGSIDKLENYLSYGAAGNKNRTENRSERVDWESGRNVGITDDIASAKAQMKHTAAASRVEKPVYQIILSWQSGNEDEGIPPDDPSREEMEETVDRVLTELGLDEHQAWMVAHRDTDTPHVHVMVNRVHPQKKTAWENTYDKSEIYNTLREIEEEKGWHRPAPKTIEEKWAQDREKSLQYWEEEHEKWDREPSVRLWAREEGVQEALREAQSWKEVQEVVDPAPRLPWSLATSRGWFSGGGRRRPP
jgi:Relaxase/Mobilisation nuclease domain.